MQVNNNLIEITLDGEKYSFEEVAKRISELSGVQLATFFLGRHVKLPRSVRIAALRAVLNPIIAISQELNLSDELRYRLLFYPYFSELQLENLFCSLTDEESFDLYKLNLARLILAGHEQLELTDLEVLAIANQDNDGNKETFETYQKNLLPAVCDNPQEFEGLTYDNFREYLSKSSTLVELREIGAKYNMNIPRRLRKEDLLQVIVNELKERELHSDDLEMQLSRMSVLMLQRFAKDNGIKASVELKKEELIEFILKVAVSSENIAFTEEVPLVYVPQIMDFDFDPAMVRNTKMLREIEVENPVVEPVTEEVKDTLEEQLVETQAEEIVKEENLETTEDEVVEEQIEEQVEEVLEEQVEEVLEEQVEEALEEQVEEVLEEQVEEALEEQVEEALEEQVEEALEEQVEEALEEQVEEALEEQVEEAIGDEFVEEQMEETFEDEFIEEEPLFDEGDFEEEPFIEEDMIGDEEDMEEAKREQEVVVEDNFEDLEIDDVDLDELDIDTEEYFAEQVQPIEEPDVVEESLVVEEEPEILEEPEVEDVPEILEEPEVEDVPEILEEPEVEDVPEIPEEPEVEDVPEIPEEPEVAEPKVLEEVKPLPDSIMNPHYDPEVARIVNINTILSEVEDVTEEEVESMPIEEAVTSEEYFEQFFQPRFVNAAAATTSKARAKELAKMQVLAIENEEKNQIRMQRLQNAQKIEKEYFESEARKQAAEQTRYYKSVRKTRKRRTIRKIIKWVIILAILCVLAVLGIAIANTMLKGTNELVKNAYDFLDKYIGWFLRYGDKLGEVIDNMIKSLQGNN